MSFCGQAGSRNPADLRGWLSACHFMLPTSAVIRNRTAIGLFLITLIALALAYQTRAPIVLEMGATDQDIFLARGFYRAEEAFGVTYRWTDGDAQIHLPGLGSGVPLYLRISLHEFRPSPLSPGPVTILLNGRGAARFTPGANLAAYDFDLPTGPVDWNGDVIIGLQSDTFVPQQAMGTNDERALGLYVDQVRVGYGPGVIVPPVIVWALLALSVMAAYGLCRVAGGGMRLSRGVGLLLLAAEVAGVAMARSWTAHNSVWLALTTSSLYLVALRLKSGQRSVVSNQLPALDRPQTATLNPLKRVNPQSEILFILAVFIIWRVALGLVPVVGADAVGVSECCPQVDPKPLTSVWQAAFDRWYRWDALWYGSIAQNGYQYAGEREASNVAFFPLFPLVNGMVSRLTGLPVPISGPLVSSLMTLAACLLLYRLARRETGDPDVAARSVVYLLAFPVAYYLAIGYSEALYALCVLGAFALAREERWWWCGLAAFLGGLARLHGALLVVPLGYEYLRQRGFQLRNLRADMVSVLGGPLGVLAFMGYLGLQFGQPLAHLQVQALFFRGIRAGAFPAFPGATLANYLSGLFSHPPATESVIEAGAMLLLLVLALEAWARLPRVYGVYMLTVALFSLVGGDLISLPRFILPMFPVFMALGLMGKHPWADRAILIASLLLQGILALMFTNGYWIA